MKRIDFLLAFRAMKKFPFINLINIMGLGVGIGAFLFITTYTWSEYSYDSVHQDADKIYRVNHVIKREGQDPYIGAATFPKVGPSLKEEYAQVEDACRLLEIYFGGIALVDNEPIEHKKIYYVDPNFFDFFSFPLLHGDVSTALSEVGSAVLSKKTAITHFGTTDCVGKLIKIKSVDGDHNYRVTAVFEEQHLTHLQPEILLSFSSFLNIVGQEVDHYWNWFDFVTYLKIEEDANLTRLDSSFVDFVDRHGGERMGSEAIDLDLIPLEDIHLKSHIHQEISKNEDEASVQILFTIGIFILLIAWINYINIYTAKATDRSKEVGIRKTLGATKGELIRQFLIEAFVVNLFATVVGLICCYLFTFFASGQLGLAIAPEYMSLLVLITLAVAILITSVFLSGTYPAIYIARFRMLTALKGGMTQGGEGRLRRLLVIFQFMIAAFMIGGTLLVIQQLLYMNNQPLGVDTSNMVVIEATDYSGSPDKHAKSLQMMKTKFEQFSGVQEVSYSSDIPGAQVAWRGSSYLMSDQRNRKLVHKMTVQKDYLDFLKVKFLAGRNFTTSNDSLSIIINEEAMHFYGFNSPQEALNEKIRFSGLDTMRVVGVVGNFYQESLKETFKPTAYFMIQQELRFLSVRINSDDLQDFISFAKSTFEMTFPDIPFVHHEMEDLLQLRHQKEVIFKRLFNLLSLLAIGISFLGLLGLAYYTVTKRKKEVGVRKVLGSSVVSIIKLLFIEFVRLVSIGNLIAFPVLWYLGQEWLNQFTFHVDFSWIIPVITLVLSLSLAFVFTLYHLLKLGRLNPVEVLNEE